jgi:hypothetical protein
VRRRIFGVFDQRFFEQVERFSQTVFRALIEIVAALEIQVVCRQVLVRTPRYGRRPLISELRLDACGDRLGDPRESTATKTAPDDGRSPRETPRQKSFRSGATL